MREAVIVALSVAVGLALMESILHGLAQPSDYSWGQLFGKQLPPFKIIPDARRVVSEAHRDPFENVVVDGVQMTRGDMLGIFRPDPVLGYAPLESSTSTNNWWHANSIGARDWDETTARRGVGVHRTLVFGESFANGSRIRQEETWPHLLEMRLDNAEVVNLAVDGYGMAQAYLRYRGLRTAIDYDLVVMMFVPTVDLWRDVNIRRDLGGEWWGNYLSMPRFVLDGNDLRLINPYPPAEVFLQSQLPDDLHDRLTAHLSRHDRFFPQRLVKLPPVIGNLVGYKMLVLFGQYDERRSFRHSLFWNADSEAQKIVRALFRRMGEEVEDDGARLLVAVLPTYRDLERFQSEPAFADQFDRVVESILASEVDCIDLSKSLSGYPMEQLDLADDHFGPRTNGLIADILSAELTSRGLIADKLSREH